MCPRRSLKSQREIIKMRFNKDRVEDPPVDPVMYRQSLGEERCYCGIEQIFSHKPPLQHTEAAAQRAESKCAPRSR